MKREFAIAAALVLVAGCGPKKDNGSAIDNTQSQAAGKTLGASIEDGASGFGPADQGTAALPACVVPSGDMTDTDADHIPLNATLTYTNCTKTNGNVTAVFNGTENVQDTDPNNATFNAA